MSGRSDIRMYVEHLFEGRTLDAETIELKEEIFGNLVARFDDYVAQGMSEGEAYARTCDAVTSVDDVMGEKDAGEKDDPLDADTVAPAAAVAPEPTTVIGSPEPPAPRTEPNGAPKRWSTGMIVAVVAIVLLVAGIAGCTVFNLLDMQRGLEDYQSQTSQTVQPVDQPNDTTYDDKTPTGDSSTSQTTSNEPDGNGTTGNDATSTSPTNGSSPQGGTGLTAEVRAHSVDELAGYAGTGLSDTARIEELVRSLPVGEYVTGVSADPGTRTVEVTYTYQDRDRVTWDDDHVDLALVYDAVALMSTLDGIDTLRVTEIEDDGYDYDRDLRVFERTMLERLLGATLDASQLTAEAWEGIRGQVMTEYVYDEAWDRAERD